MGTQDDLKKDDPGSSELSETRVSNHSADTRQGDTTIVLGNGRLLLLFAGVVLICGLFFVFGFLEGRRNATRSALWPDGFPSSETAPLSDESPGAEYATPSGPHPGPVSLYLMDEQEDRPQPTGEQIVLIRRLLPADTRIRGMARLDADPPLVFVLHQPQSQVSGDTELTMFRFRKEGIDSENVVSPGFIPDFLIDRDGRAIGAWPENPTGGNAWSCSSLATMVIEQGEVTYPEIQLNTCQVAKDLSLDRGVPVLIVWDTRFEYFEGLCRACSPIKQAIFELDRGGGWLDATSRHRPLVERWIQDDIRDLQEAKARKDDYAIGKAALNTYLDAETAGHASRYRSMVEHELREIGWLHFVEMIDEANRRKCCLADLVGRCTDLEGIRINSGKVDLDEFPP